MRPSSRLHRLRVVEAAGGSTGDTASAKASPLDRPAAEPRRLRGAVVPHLLPYVEDRDFLPPALGLAQTPISPIRTVLMLTICLLAAAALAWAYFGRIDILATARGEIEPAGHVKIVQPIDSGKVDALLIEEGQSVAVGDVLLRLDARVASADLEAARKTEIGALAEAQRRAAAIAIVRSPCRTCWHEPSWSDDIPASVRAREDAVLHGDLDELAATLANLSDQQQEKDVAVAQSARNIEAQSKLRSTLNERVDMRNTLVANLVGSRSGVIDAMQSLREAETQLVAEDGRHDMAVAALRSLKSEQIRTVDVFLADQNRKLSDARRLAEVKSWERVRAEARVDQATLRAPIAGTIQNLSVTTKGQVVAAGQELLRIVPADDRLVIRAYVTNDDIGFIKRGQVATAKIDAFPFTQFGALKAKVASVSQDAVPASVADETLVDRSRTGTRFSPTLTPSARPMTDLLFATTLDLETPARADGDGSIVPRPGMTVTVEIKTGSRRIIDYMLAPLMETEAGALHER